MLLIRISLNADPDPDPAIYLNGTVDPDFAIILVENYLHFFCPYSNFFLFYRITLAKSRHRSPLKKDNNYLDLCPFQNSDVGTLFILLHQCY